MIGARTGTRRTANQHAQSILGYALFAMLLLHAVLLLPSGSHPVVASRLATSAAPLLAAFCGLWRAKNVAPREELPWRMLSASMVLWAVGQAVEALIGRSHPPSTLRWMERISLISSRHFPCCSRCRTRAEPNPFKASFIWIARRPCWQRFWPGFFSIECP